MNTPEPKQEGELANTELSAEVAVRFLGNKWLRSVDDKFRESEAFLCSPKNLPRFDRGYIEADEKWARKSYDLYWAQDPTTSIADAMEVVEKMRERGLGIVICDNMGRKKWDVEIWCGDDTELASVRSESLPEAICRAALATKETK